MSAATRRGARRERAHAGPAKAGGETAELRPMVAFFVAHDVRRVGSAAAGRPGPERAP